MEPPCGRRNRGGLTRLSASDMKVGGDPSWGTNVSFIQVTRERADVQRTGGGSDEPPPGANGAAICSRRGGALRRRAENILARSPRRMIG